jgi:seryl-tRNA synthetase
MLDIKAVRKDPEGIAEKLLKRGYTFDTAHFLALDAKRKQADIDSQGLLAQRKTASKKIGELVGKGMSVDDAKASVNETLDKIAAEIDGATEQAKQVQQDLDQLLLSIPNVPHEHVPVGTSEDDNIEVSRWGEPKLTTLPCETMLT